MRSEFEKLPTIARILNKGLFEFSEYTQSYHFRDAMACINARPSWHKDHGYLNGAYVTYVLIKESD